MNTPAIDIKDLLVTAGIGTFNSSSGWSIHCASEPDAPNTTITLYDLPGGPPGRYASRTKADTEDWVVQVRVRAKTYRVAINKAKEVHDLLNKHARWAAIGDSSAGGTYTYIGVRSQQGFPTPLQRDDKQRWIVVESFHVLREEQ